MSVSTLTWNVGANVWVCVIEQIESEEHSGVVCFDVGEGGRGIDMKACSSCSLRYMKECQEEVWICTLLETVKVNERSVPVWVVPPGWMFMLFLCSFPLIMS